MIAHAPLCLVFVADYQKWVDYFHAESSPQKSGKQWRDPGYGDLHLAIQDSISACQSGVVMAESLGIGSCYIGDVMENGEELQKLLDCPALHAFLHGHHGGTNTPFPTPSSRPVARGRLF
jgi:nitroreductase